MNYLIELGVFDDGDRAPTQIIALYTPPEDVVPADIAALCQEMLQAAESTLKRFRPIPPHAQFWACSPQPDDIEIP